MAATIPVQPFSSLYPSQSPPHHPPSAPPEPPPLWAIVGLGNPGRLYANTRHSVGASFISFLAASYHLTLQPTPSLLAASAVCSRTLPRVLTRTQRASLSVSPSVARRLLLAIPSTYMNLSGSCVARILPLLPAPPPSSHSLIPHPLIVVHDDIELPFGSFRLALDGASRSSHNGLRSITPHTGDRLLRIRVGVGQPEGGTDLASYVLQKMAKREREALRADLFPRMQRLVEGVCTGDVEQARALYQGDTRRPSREGSGGSSSRAVRLVAAQPPAPQA